MHPNKDFGFVFCDGPAIQNNFALLIWRRTIHQHPRSIQHVDFGFMRLFE